MAAATLISVEEYLSTTYRPDCDFVDGELLERNVGEYEHSNLQGALIVWLRQNGKLWNIRVLPEQRVQVRATRFRIPDVCILSRDQPVERFPTRPPLVCIEILSKDDTLRRMQERVTDYLEFGVPHVWIVDPATQRAYVCTTHGFLEPEGGILEVPGSPIRVPLADLFRELD